jgi:hypothetical protein
MCIALVESLANYRNMELYLVESGRDITNDHMV